MLLHIHIHKSDINKLYNFNFDFKTDEINQVAPETMGHSLRMNSSQDIPIIQVPLGPIYRCVILPAEFVKYLFR